MPTLKLAAEARKVPADKASAAATDLGAAFLEQCTTNAWPAGILGCLGQSPQDLDTYRRCFEHLSAAKRTAWNARLDGIVGAAAARSTRRPLRSAPRAPPSRSCARCSSPRCDRLRHLRRRDVPAGARGGLRHRARRANRRRGPG